MQKENEFGCNHSLGSSLFYAFRVKKQLTVAERIKPKHLNLCIGHNFIQLRIKWTINIGTTIYNMDLGGKIKVPPVWI